MRSADEFNNVQRLVAAGMNDCAIARLTGIPRSDCPGLAMQSCRSPTQTNAVSISIAASTTTSPRFPQRRTATCSGLYLGDGCISRGTSRLASADHA